MPNAPPALCPRCRGTKPGTCKCAKRNDTRESAAKRGYNWAWSGPQGAAKRHLAANPLCVECSKEGRTVAATEVDHIVPHRGDKELFWNPDNWQSLCKSHHSQKTKRGE